MKAKGGHDLAHCGTQNILVYTAGTGVPVPDGAESLNPGERLLVVTTSSSNRVLVTNRRMHYEN